VKQNCGKRVGEVMISQPVIGKLWALTNVVLVPRCELNERGYIGTTSVHQKLHSNAKESLTTQSSSEMACLLWTASRGGFSEYHYHHGTD
jgi:hypothetical protein